MKLADLLYARIRARLQDTRIILRGDSGLSRDALKAFREGRAGGFYFLGLARNRRLQKAIGEDACEAAMLRALTGRASRVFKELRRRTRKSWTRERRVVAKAEHLAKGPNPRFVVPNLDPSRILYEDLYCARGQMENLIKEQQLFLCADRTSCHRFRATSSGSCSGFLRSPISSIASSGASGSPQATMPVPDARPSGSMCSRSPPPP